MLAGMTNAQLQHTPVQQYKDKSLTTVCTGLFLSGGCTDLLTVETDAEVIFTPAL